MLLVEVALDTYPTLDVSNAVSNVFCLAARWAHVVDRLKPHPAHVAEATTIELLIYLNDGRNVAMIARRYGSFGIPRAVPKRMNSVAIIRDCDPKLVNDPAVHLAESSTRRRLACSPDERADTRGIKLGDTHLSAAAALLEFLIRLPPLKARGGESTRFIGRLQAIKVDLYTDPLSCFYGGCPDFCALAKPRRGDVESHAKQTELLDRIVARVACLNSPTEFQLSHSGTVVSDDDLTIASVERSCRR